jgi:hypothetical protein
MTLHLGYARLKLDHLLTDSVHVLSLDVESAACTLTNPSFEPEMMLFRAKPGNTPGNALLLIDIRSVDKDVLKPLAHAYVPV